MHQKSLRKLTGSLPYKGGVWTVPTAEDEDVAVSAGSSIRLWILGLPNWGAAEAENNLSKI